MEGGYIDGFPIEFTVNVEPPYTISTTGDMEGCMNAELASCSQTPATWDNSDTIDVVANIPAGIAFPENMEPTTIEFRTCFAPSSTVDRKWRAINDPFKVCFSPHSSPSLSQRSHGIYHAVNTCHPRDILHGTCRWMELVTADSFCVSAERQFLHKRSYCQGGLGRG